MSWLACAIGRVLKILLKEVSHRIASINQPTLVSTRSDFVCVFAADDDDVVALIVMGGYGALSLADLSGSAAFFNKTLVAFEKKRGHASSLSKAPTDSQTTTVAAGIWCIDTMHTEVAWLGWVGLVLCIIV
jgi:hypothetical protein